MPSPPEEKLKVIPPPTGNTSLISFFTDMDMQILQSGNEYTIQNYLVQKNIQMRDYLIQKYPGRDAEGLDVYDPDFTVFALLFAALEAEGFETPPPAEARTANAPGWLACTFGVLHGIVDIEIIRNDFNALVAGRGTFTTTFRLVKSLLKRYFGWIMVGIALYEIGTTCF